MLSILFKAIDSCASFLFPLFASYKALKANDPQLLTPWLMYWTTLSVVLFTESWLGFILNLVPFYSMLRMMAMLYLVAPTHPQGSSRIYLAYIHPMLEEHEREIEETVSTLHDKTYKYVLAQLRRMSVLIKTYITGSTPPAEPQPTYAQSIFDKFKMLPLDVSALYQHDSPTERLAYINAQKKKLTAMLSALDEAATKIPPGEDFEKVEKEDIPVQHSWFSYSYWWSAPPKPKVE